MKKAFKIFICIIIPFACIIAVLNLNVTTRQGINFKVSVIKIPLYLKVLDFFDRHYNYKQLVHRITAGAKSDEERVIRIFNWTYEHIKKQPSELPVIDDHVWNIIVRGYGKDDQSCDVFSTLCNYAGFRSFYDYVPSVRNSAKIILSYVSIGELWYVFDPYNGIFFTNKKNVYASVDDIKNGNWRLEYSGPEGESIPDYKEFLSGIVKLKQVGLCRENIQSPLRRILFELQKKQR